MATIDSAVPSPRGSVPTSVRAITIAVLLFMLVLMTGDLVVWAHGEMHWSTLATVLGSETLIVGLWLAAQMRSDRYARPTIEQPARWFVHHLQRLPLLIIGFIVCTYGLRYLMFALHGGHYHASWALLLPLEAVKVTLLYCCWLGIVFGFESAREVRERNERLLNAQRSLAEAQLTQLRAQLRPHFLFNALNTVSAAMHADVPRADRLLTQLGDLLRANLESSDRNVVTLDQEMQLLRRYAEIMQARFGDRVTIEWDVAQDALGVTIPSMLLQPLLENAFKHGIEHHPGPQTIRVQAARTSAGVDIRIYNSGSSLAQPYREGFGLRSCRERLALMYGGVASCSVRDLPQGGVEAIVRIPAHVST